MKSFPHYLIRRTSARDHPPGWEIIDAQSQITERTCATRREAREQCRQLNEQPRENPKERT